MEFCACKDYRVVIYERESTAFGPYTNKNKYTLSSALPGRASRVEENKMPAVAAYQWPVTRCTFLGIKYLLPDTAKRHGSTHRVPP